MDISETKALIAKGVRQHLRQVSGMMELLPSYEPDTLEAFQVGVQILCNLHPEIDDMKAWTGAEMREFAMSCGVSKEDAERYIHDSEPLALY